MSNSDFPRRRFLAGAALIGCAASSTAAPLPGEPIPAGTALGPLHKAEGKTPIEGAAWYTADAEGAGLVHRFPAGTLAKGRYIVADMLLDGDTLAVFSIALQEGDAGRVFQYGFGGLTQCGFRVRLPLETVNQNRFFLSREGALLKPMCLGDRVDLDKVDRLVFTLRRKGPAPVRWCMTPFHLSPTEPEKISRPALPKGPLLDRFGQSAQRSWPAKTRGVDEMKARLSSQFESAPKQSWPEMFSRWGGWKSNKLGEATGFFRTHNDGARWWLVDPDGYAFWSAGMDCVRVDCDARYDGLETALEWIPDDQGEFAPAHRGAGRGGKSINYLAANLIRALGPQWHDRWAAIALGELKRLRFNTVGNWSEWEIARAARFPYVRPLNFRGGRSSALFRDFPDVFDPAFEKEAATYAEQLRDTAQDPAFLGYFLMNEPAWGSSSEVPASGMLFNSERAAARVELARFLKTRYPDDAALRAAWKRPEGFDRVAEGKWTGVLNADAQRDLRDFSIRMVERYFQTLSAACKRVDPNHLNLGMRWAGVPPAWAVEGMKCFDVFSLNRYSDKLPREQSARIHDMLKRPVMVGEFHFGALDAGLPASGIGHVRTQEDRGRAYRVYLEDAAQNPHCVGAHWFTLYDESALGRGDGENYNIGFLDICNRPYEPIGRAARLTHERMYEVAAGRAEPFRDAPEYLPKVFL